MASQSQRMKGNHVIEVQVRMDCNGCVQKIKKALHAIHGISELYIDFPGQKITIIGNVEPELIVKAIKRIRKSAIICSHTELQEEQPSQPPEEQPSEDGGGAPPSTEPTTPPAEEPPKDKPPPPSVTNPPQEEIPLSEAPPRMARRPSMDMRDSHQRVHRYNYGYGDGPQNWNHYRPASDMGFKHQPPPTGIGFQNESPPLQPPSPPRGSSRFHQQEYDSNPTRSHSGIKQNPPPPIRLEQHEPPPPPPQPNSSSRFDRQKLPQPYIPNEPRHDPFIPIFYQDGLDLRHTQPPPPPPPPPPPRFDRQELPPPHNPNELKYGPSIPIFYQPPQPPPPQQPPPQTPPPLASSSHQSLSGIRQPIYVSHSYNAYKPLPYVTGYEYASPPPPRHMHHDRYTEGMYPRPRTYEGSDYSQPRSSPPNHYSENDIASMFSEENPNACVIS